MDILAVLNQVQSQELTNNLNNTTDYLENSDPEFNEIVENILIQKADGLLDAGKKFPQPSLSLSESFFESDLEWDQAETEDNPTLYPAHYSLQAVILPVPDDIKPIDEVSDKELNILQAEEPFQDLHEFDKTDRIKNSVDNSKSVVLRDPEQEPQLAMKQEGDSLELRDVTPNEASEAQTDFSEALQAEISLKRDAAVLSPKPNIPEVTLQSFDSEIGNQLKVMIDTGLNTADVQMNPPELGQINIKIVQEADKTHVIFLTSNEQTHDLIESTLSSLCHSLENQGIALGDVTVGYKEQDSAREGLGNTRQAYSQKNSQDPELQTQVGAIHLPLNDSLLDIYI